MTNKKQEQLREEFMENWNEFGNVVNIETLENKIPDIWKGIRNDIKENVWKWIEKATKI